MQEVLKKTIDPKSPLRDQELYELTLLDEANASGTRYLVRKAHAEWVEVDGQLMWDGVEVEYFWILADAQRRYEEHRRGIAELGFICSDLDPIC